MIEEENSKPKADYEKAELDLLKAGLNRSYTERFTMMTTLMKMDMMFKKATKKHKPFPASDK